MTLTFFAGKTEVLPRVPEFIRAHGSPSLKFSVSLWLICKDKEACGMSNVGLDFF